MSITTIINGIVDRESPKYTNDPTDRGGPTKFGITQATLSKWRGKAVTPADVEALQRPEAYQIYENIYIIQPGFSQIKNGQLYEALIDFGVTSGSGDSIKTLQKVLGTKQDGALGPVTAAAANSRDGRTLCNAFSCERARFYCNEVQARPQNVKYVEGWVMRALGYVV